MAKRGAETQSSRTGSFIGDGTNKSGEESDVPQRATAAQLAKRKIATGRSLGRAAGARAGQTLGAGLAQQQQQPQQQAHAPFGNVDPNVVNGTSKQQNPLPTPATTDPTLDSQSPSFNLWEYNNTRIFPGYVPNTGSNEASGFNFHPNGASSNSNPFAPATNGGSDSTESGGTLTGYAGSLFSMPPTVPAKAQEPAATPKQQERRNYVVDPNLNKTNEGKLWASHAPFIQSPVDQIPDNTKSVFTDDFNKNEAQKAAHNPALASQINIITSKPKSSAALFGASSSQPQQSQQRQQQAASTNPFKQSAPQPASSTGLFQLSFNNQSQQQPQQTQQSQPFSTNFGQLHQPQQSFLTNFGQPEQLQQSQEQAAPSNSFNQFTPQPAQSTSLFQSSFNDQSQQQQQAQQAQQTQQSQPFSTGFVQQQQLQPQQPFSGSFGQPFGQQQSPQSLGLFSQAPQISSSNLFNTPNQQTAKPASEGAKTFGSLDQSPFGSQKNPVLSPKDDSVSLSPDSNTSMGEADDRNDSIDARIRLPPAPPSSSSSSSQSRSSHGSSIAPITPSPVLDAPGESSSLFQQKLHLNENKNREKEPPPEPVMGSSIFGSSSNWSTSTPISTYQRNPFSNAENEDEDETPKARPTKETAVNPLFSAAQTSMFSTNSKAQPSAQSGSLFSSFNSKPIAKTVVKVPEAPSGSGQKSLPRQQMETLMPPTCPRNFNETQKLEYITHYRIRSLNHAFKKNIDSALTFPVDVEVLRFYYAKMDQILANGSISCKASGTKRKWVGDIQGGDGTGPNKRITTNSTLRNAESLPTTPSHINKSKRKADEEISKSSGENASLDTGKKARSDLSYPTLPQTSETARLFAKAANGETLGSPPSMPTVNGTDSSQSLKTGIQAHTPNSMFGSNTGNTSSSSIFSTPKAAPSSSTSGAQSLFQFKPSTTNPTLPAKGSSNLSSGSFNSGKAATPAQPSSFKVPSFGAPSGTSFMSQFGQNAKKIEEEMAKEAKAKRKADEYDSEEDDEQAWERKYDEEQRAKKQKIEEAKTNNSFKFVPKKVSGGNEKSAESLSTSQPHPAVSASSNTVGSGSVLQTPSKADLANPWAHLHKQADTETQGDNESESSDEDELETQASKIEAALASDASSTSAPRSLFDRTKTNSDGSLKREVPQPSVIEQKEASHSSSLFAQQPIFSGKSASTTIAPRSGLFGQPLSNSQNTGLFGSASDRSPTPKAAVPGGQLNNTWAAGSPIKFGGANSAPSLSFTSPSPPKPTSNEQNSGPFSTLFGAKPATNSFTSQSTTFGALSNSTPSTTTGSIFATAPSASPAGPVVGFQFGGPPKPFGSLAAPPSFNSATSSRATSPGLSTGGESAAEGGEEDGPPDVQIDLASARAGEENEECLLEVKAKSLEMVWVTKKDEGQKKESTEREWAKRGLGPLRVLKNHATGKVRIVHRVEGVGKIILNAALMEGMTYKHATEKTVTFGIATGAGNIAQWTIMVGSKDKAANLASLLEENKSN